MYIFWCVFFFLLKDKEREKIIKSKRLESLMQDICKSIHKPNRLR